MQNIPILTVIVLSAGLLAWPKLANAPLWRATITPLASIIGSGFLVLGPILVVSYGGYAPLAMVILCAIAYAFGSAIRFNIAQIALLSKRAPFTERLEIISSAILAFAFVISVAYYLNLFGAFAVRLTPFNNPYYARLLTSSVLILILIVGWTRGFRALERLEQISVGLKLSIIAGLLFGLTIFFAQKVQSAELLFNPAKLSPWASFTLLAGLIVTVQGFETSRYLGDTYEAKMRIHSMYLAQWISTAIYVVYILLLAYTFDAGSFTLDETAIIDLMQIVAPILPLLLVAAALGAQFSAAIADTSGSGGLVFEISRGKISNRSAYAILVSICLLLTWTANIFEIISYASRAFAAYYAIQSAIAAATAFKRGFSAKASFFAALSLLGIICVVFGQSVE